MKRMLILSALFGLGYVYLFVTAPAPLPEANAGTTQAGAGTIPVAAMFDIVNLINSKTRQIYTERIVTSGQTARLKFDEHWADKDVEAGPLPALFVRLIASKLQARQSELALFLGSDRPINKSNYFQGEQLAAFTEVRRTGQPQLFSIPKLGLSVGLYADIAAANGCVTCHNQHARSPKRDWRLNDVMGATTWTYPRTSMSLVEMRSRVAEVYVAIKEAYEDYLVKAQTFAEPVKIGGAWPEKGKRALPDADTFMAAVLAATGPNVARTAFLELERK